MAGLTRVAVLALVLVAGCRGPAFDAEQDGMAACHEAFDERATTSAKSITSRVEGDRLVVSYWVKAPLGADRSGAPPPDYVCEATLGTKERGAVVTSVRP